MDDDEQQQPAPIFALPAGIFRDPEEEQRLEMIGEELFTQFGDWMRNAPEEDILMLRKLIGMSAGSPPTGQQLIGMLAAANHFRFGNCIGCGRNHFDTSNLPAHDAAPE